MKAIVYKSTGNQYRVVCEDGTAVMVGLKGRFKKGDISSTNPIAVGDEVVVEYPEDPQRAMIADILPRRNYINRISPHNKKQYHIVAANLDQTLLFATLREPRTSNGFIDRFLVTAEAYHVPAILVFNKIDLLETEELALLEHLTTLYRQIGYTVVHTSLWQGQGLSDLHALLQHKTTLISGHSGVGKSTFVNQLFPDLGLKVQEVSEWSGKGLHTTTFAQMYDLPGGGRLIDTPGIRELGLVDVERSELAHYFPEMRQRMSECQFNNCAHINEPGCGIKKALGEDSRGVSEERYISYLSIYESIAENRY